MHDASGNETERRGFILPFDHGEQHDGGADTGEGGSLIAEVDQVAEATGTRIPPYTALVLASLQGREAEASALIEEAATQRQGIAETVAHWVAAILYNGLGRYEEAQQAAEQASSAPLDLYAAMWALPS